MNNKNFFIILSIFLIILAIIGTYEFNNINEGSIKDLKKAEFLTFNSNAVEYENNDTVDITWTYVNPNLDQTKYKVIVNFANFSQSKEFTLDSYGDTYSNTFQFDLNNTSLDIYPCTLEAYEYDETYNKIKTINLGDINVVESKTNTTYITPKLTLNTIPSNVDISSKYNTLFDVETPITLDLPRYEDYKFNVISEGYESYTFTTNIENESVTLNIELEEIVPKTKSNQIQIFVQNQNELSIRDATIFIDGKKYNSRDDFITVDVSDEETAIVAMKEGYQPFVHTYNFYDNEKCIITLNKIGEKLIDYKIQPATTTEIVKNTNEEVNVSTPKSEITITDDITDSNIIIDQTENENDNGKKLINMLLIIGFFVSLYILRKK